MFSISVFKISFCIANFWTSSFPSRNTIFNKFKSSAVNKKSLINCVFRYILFYWQSELLENFSHCKCYKLMEELNNALTTIDTSCYLWKDSIRIFVILTVLMIYMYLCYMGIALWFKLIYTESLLLIYYFYHYLYYYYYDYSFIQIEIN